MAAYRPQLEALLRRYYRDEIRRAPKRFRPHLELLEEYTLRGGKRLRALLVLAGYHLVRGSRPDPGLPAAAALEMFQSWMLIHDDIIDHAEMRRGGPSLHRKVEVRHRRGHWSGAPGEYGVAMGITLGDLQEPLTVRALLDSSVPPRCREGALAEYVRMTGLTAYGQVLDIENGLSPIARVKEPDVLLVHRLKSAVYTVAAPLRIGAILAGGSPALLRALDAVGLDLGIAFQLRDDLLGAGFDAAAIAKSANDIAEGKRTLLVVYAWQHANADGRRLLRRVLGDPSAPSVATARVRQLMQSTGSVAYSERMIARLQRRASRRIARTPSLSPSGRRLLDQVGAKLLYRSV